MASEDIGASHHVDDIADGDVDVGGADASNMDLNLEGIKTDDLGNLGFPMSSPMAEQSGSSAAAGSAAQPASSPTAQNAGPPYYYSAFIGNIVELPSDGSTFRRAHDFIGKWRLGEDLVSSSFRYGFNVTPSAYPQPVHSEGATVTNPALPSLHSHPMLGVPVVGTYIYAEGTPNQMTIHEPSHKMGPKSAGAMSWKIGGRVPEKPDDKASAPPQGVPNPMDMAQGKEGLGGTAQDYIGITGSGHNQYVGSIHWWGAYHPSSGRLVMVKYWRNQHAPIVRARSAPKGAAAPDAASGQKRPADPALQDNARREAAAAKDSINPDLLRKLNKIVYREGVEEKLSLEQKLLEDPFLDIRDHKTAPWMFIQPVDRTAFPTYDAIIAQPMCLNDVQAKLEEGAYATADDFVRDMNLIWANAKTFTKDARAQVVMDASYFEAEFEKAMRRYRNDLQRAKAQQDKAKEKEEAARAKADREAAAKRAKQEADAERQRAAAERAARAAELGESGSVEHKPKSVKRPRPDGMSGEDGGSVSMFDGEGGAEGGDFGASGLGASSGPADGSGHTPTAAPSQLKKPRVVHKEPKPAASSAPRAAAAAGPDTTAEIRHLTSVMSQMTDAMKMMMEFQAKTMAATAGVGMPVQPMMQPMMQAAGHAMGQFNNLMAQHGGAPLATAVPQPAKKANVGRKPGAKAKKADHDDGDDFLTGEDLDDFLDGDDEDYKHRAKKGGAGKAGASGKDRRASKAASAMDATLLPLTDAEKTKLSEDVSSLPGEDVERVIQMLVERNLVAPNAEGEVELDMSAIPTATLRELQRIVADKLNKAAAPKVAEPARKGPGRPPGAGVWAGSKDQREDIVANAARVAMANADKISALGTLNMGASAAGNYGGFEGDDVLAMQPPL